MKITENFIFNKKRWHTNNCLREDETANVFLITSNVFVTRLIMDSLFYLETLKIYMPAYRVAQNDMPT